MTTENKTIDYDAIKARARATHRRWPTMAEIGQQRQDIPDLLAVIDAVRELHAPNHEGGMGYYGPTASSGYGHIAVTCPVCGDDSEYAVAYPCPTIRALDGLR